MLATLFICCTLSHVSAQNKALPYSLSVAYLNEGFNYSGASIGTYWMLKDWFNEASESEKYSFVGIDASLTAGIFDTEQQAYTYILSGLVIFKNLGDKSMIVLGAELGALRSGYFHESMQKKTKKNFLANRYLLSLEHTPYLFSKLMLTGFARGSVMITEAKHPIQQEYWFLEIGLTYFFPLF
jgi:hypothetical protein